MSGKYFGSDRISELWETIKEYVGEHILANIYSIEEQIIGRWIDGRSLYRKCYFFSNTNLTLDTWVSIAQAPNDIDSLCSCIGSFLYKNKNEYRTIPHPSMAIAITGESVKCYTDDRSYVNGGAGNLFLVIEYTKTTDSPTLNPLPSSGVEVATSEPPMQKAGTIVQDGVSYDYEFKQDAFGYASASGVATSVASSVREALS